MRRFDSGKGNTKRDIRQARQRGNSERSQRYWAQLDAWREDNGVV